ncbi:hypothetical protein MNBD_CHLOROFLEXI01-2142 [hydrothermal vent metagenome]|uniref:Uncharacterized protein n=1 Tax=hydrothermal vent metagenome TaxID=652676 RepID=A0A3B0VF75_9ZZZZ
MDRPEKLILLSDDSYLKVSRSTVFVGIGIMAFVMGIARIQTNVTLADLMLPIAALSTFWLFWTTLHIISELIHKFSTKRAINRLFEGKIWHRWQFHPDEWQGIVKTEYQMMSPKRGVNAYIGAVYSSIAGFVISAILVGVGKFVIKDEQAMPAILITAGAVLLLLLGVGLIQPIQKRYQAQKYRRKALQTLTPRVWFGAEGVYHEIFGFTSLKKLKGVSDHTRKLKTIKFTIEVTSFLGGAKSYSKLTHYVPVSFSVPTGHEQQASQLVRRYRQEQLSD